MTEIGVVLIGLALVILIISSLRRQRRRAAELDADDASWLTAEEPADISARAPVSDFHVHGAEAQVTFDVPLPDEEDDILFELLVDEGVEVVREKRHVLPIDDVTEIVVFAGRPEIREVGRTKLPSAGELPPPVQSDLLNFTHIAKDPFASQFDVDHSVSYDTAVQVPEDELAPLRDELRIPLGLERGLRARGVDPGTVTGPELVVALLELFGYSVTAQREPGTYMAFKDGLQTFIRTEAHQPGDHPELSEGMVKKFVFEFGTSGAQRGLFITDKYGPFMVHDVESKEKRVRFITRERTQRFIDSMALG